MGVPRDLLPKWDDIQFIVGQLHKLPRLDDTGICSGEGGMLPEEQAANSRYFYELASARFGFSWDRVEKTQAFHFKGGQGAKTGTGGHLPGNKVKGKIAEVRELPEGQAAISLALGADGVAVSNAAIQAIGCLGMRACHSNNCPVGIATQKPQLRARLPVDTAAERLARFFGASVDLMAVLARAAGHNHLNQFSIDDLTTFDADMVRLAGVAYGGVDLTGGV